MLFIEVVLSVTCKSWGGESRRRVLGTVGPVCRMQPASQLPTTAVAPKTDATCGDIGLEWTLKTSSVLSLTVRDG